MILVEEKNDTTLKISFKYCDKYFQMMRNIRKEGKGVSYRMSNQTWNIPKSNIKILDKYCKDRLVWRVPRWVVMNEPKPDYSKIYNVKDYTMPKLKQGVVPHKYQEYGVKFMIDKLFKYGFVFNCDGTGIGKTIQSIMTFEWFKQNKGNNKCIVVCGATLKHQWKVEGIEEFTDNECIVAKGVKSQRISQYKKFNSLESGVLIINPHLIANDIIELSQMKIDFMIIDEATDVKARNGVMNKALCNLVNKPASFLKKNKELSAKNTFKIPYVVFLSATPITSKPDDLYGIIQIKDKSILGKWSDFENEYIDYETKQFYKVKVGYKNLSKLKEIVQDFIIRRTEFEIDVKLPSTISKKYSVERDKTQTKIFEDLQVKRENTLDLLGKTSKEEREKLNNRLLLYSSVYQAASNDARLITMSKSKYVRKQYQEFIPKSYKMSNKTELCLSLIEKILERDEKCIIFTVFERQVKLLEKDIKRKFPNQKVLYVTGNTTEEQDNDTLDSFKRKDDCNILIGTSKIDKGFNLQCCNNVIHFDLPKTQDGIAQRRGRAVRVGSTFEKVREYFLLTEQSFDTEKYERLKIQKFTSNGVLQTDKEQSKTLKEKSN